MFASIKSWKIILLAVLISNLCSGQAKAHSIKTKAGNAYSGAVEGALSISRLSSPFDVAVDNNGNSYLVNL
jgi:hypothetical protein